VKQIFLKIIFKALDKMKLQVVAYSVDVDTSFKHSHSIAADDARLLGCDIMLLGE
jgi:hypothetical protein